MHGQRGFKDPPYKEVEILWIPLQKTQLSMVVKGGLIGWNLEDIRGLKKIREIAIGFKNKAEN